MIFQEFLHQSQFRISELSVVIVESARRATTNSLALLRIVLAAIAAVEELSVEQLDSDNGENDLEN